MVYWTLKQNCCLWALETGPCCMCPPAAVELVAGTHRGSTEQFHVYGSGGAQGSTGHHATGRSIVAKRAGVGAQPELPLLLFGWAGAMFHAPPWSGDGACWCCNNASCFSKCSFMHLHFEQLTTFPVTRWISLRCLLNYSKLLQLNLHHLAFVTIHHHEQYMPLIWCLSGIPPEMVRCFPCFELILFPDLFLEFAFLPL